MLLLINGLRATLTQREYKIGHDARSSITRLPLTAKINLVPRALRVLWSGPARARGDLEVSRANEINARAATANEGSYSTGPPHWTFCLAALRPELAHVSSARSLVTLDRRSVDS